MTSKIYTADEWNAKNKIDAEKQVAETKKKAAAEKTKREEADKAKGRYYQPSGNKPKAAE